MNSELRKDFVAPPSPVFTDLSELEDRLQREGRLGDIVAAETSKVVVGQRYMMERILMGLLCNGHVLLEGVPGLAKTLAVRTFADSISAQFSRVQFTPDLLPADVIGTTLYNAHDGTFGVRRGPVFANIVLADEINRAPAKVQSALLEAMQERQVTIGDRAHPLPTPFIVLATQNPIEQEGTYPLPEAQVDRFLLKVKVSYPKRDEERTMLERMAKSRVPRAQPVVTLEQLSRARAVVDDIYVDPRVNEYILDLVFATREPMKHGLKELAPLIEFGASPRATLALSQASRAHAFLRHRAFVTPEDVKAICFDVLRHRVCLTYEAEAEGTTAENVLQRVLDRVEVP